MRQKKHFLDNKQNIKRVIYVLYVICALLFILDFVINRHATHPLDAMPGFYPAYGFIGCVLLVIIAKWLRTLIKRSDDYYEHEGSKLALNRRQENRQNHADN